MTNTVKRTRGDAKTCALTIIRALLKRLRCCINSNSHNLSLILEIFRVKQLRIDQPVHEQEQYL